MCHHQIVTKYVIFSVKRIKTKKIIPVAKIAALKQGEILHGISYLQSIKVLTFLSKGLHFILLDIILDKPTQLSLKIMSTCTKNTLIISFCRTQRPKVEIKFVSHSPHSFSWQHFRVKIGQLSLSPDLYLTLSGT